MIRDTVASFLQAVLVLHKSVEEKRKQWRTKVELSQTVKCVVAVCKDQFEGRHATPN